MSYARTSAKRTGKLVALAVAVAVSLALTPDLLAQSSDESASGSLVNSARAAAGRGSLATVAGLDSVARAHAGRMAARDVIFHNTNLKAEASAAGIDWTLIGENVGVGSSVQKVHEGFMASSVHHSNLVHPGFDSIGVGVAVGGDGSVFVVHVFAAVAAPAPAPVVAEPAPAVQETVAPAPAPEPVVEAAPAPAPVRDEHAAAVETTSPDPNAVIGGVVSS